MYDDKNVRRRVYDALNVLMAVDILYKDKKTITWKGFPTPQQLQIALSSATTPAPTPKSSPIKKNANNSNNNNIKQQLSSRSSSPVSSITTSTSSSFVDSSMIKQQSKENMEEIKALEFQIQECTDRMNSKKHVLSELLQELVIILY